MLLTFMKFQVVIQRDEDGVYVASCPALKGCHSSGETYEESLVNIKEAIELYVEDVADVELDEVDAYPKIIATEEVVINQ